MNKELEKIFEKHKMDKKYMPKEILIIPQSHEEFGAEVNGSKNNVLIHYSEDRESKQLSFYPINIEDTGEIKHRTFINYYDFNFDKLLTKIEENKVLLKVIDISNGNSMYREVENLIHYKYNNMFLISFKKKPPLLEVFNSPEIFYKTEDGDDPMIVIPIDYCSLEDVITVACEYFDKAGEEEGLRDYYCVPSTHKIVPIKVKYSKCNQDYIPCVSFVDDSDIAGYAWCIDLEETWDEE